MRYYSWCVNKRPFKRSVLNFSYRFHSQIEIYAEVKNFSFYENKGNLYINARVIEKRVFQNCHPSKSKFEEVRVGDTLEIKTDREKIESEEITSTETLVTLLLNRFLILTIDNWVPAAQSFSKQSSPKFILSSASKCDIFQEK